MVLGVFAMRLTNCRQPFYIKLYKSVHGRLILQSFVCYRYELLVELLF